MTTDIMDQPFPRLRKGDVLKHKDRSVSLVGDLVIEGPLGDGGTAIVYSASGFGIPHRLAVKIPRSLGSLPDLIVEGRWTPPAEEKAPWTADWYGVHLMVLPDIEDLAIPVTVSREYHATLENYCKKHGDHGAMPPDQCLTWMIQVATCLRESRLLHRDLKPDNIFVDHAANARVGDWGLAIPANPIERRKLQLRPDDFHFALATPEFMSPEQVYRDASCDHRSDIYTMGLILGEIATGHPLRPIRGKDADLAKYLATLVKTRFYLELGACPPAIRGIVERMTKIDPKSRYGSWDEAIEACTSALSSKPRRRTTSSL